MHQFNLERFTEEQDGIYPQVLSELRQGKKRSHWMWFIFPQIRGLGRSDLAVTFSVSGQEEARAYIAHPILGVRLKECTSLVMAISARSLNEIFGSPDDLKFRSSMTLFDFVAPDTIFDEALAKFCGGGRDPATITMLAKG
jgi:uncharacterized protein (DUF1810 family)